MEPLSKHLLQIRYYRVALRPCFKVYKKKYLNLSGLNLLVTCLTIPKHLSHSCSKEKQLFDSEEELDEISERPTTRNVSNQSNTAPITGQAKVRGKI